MLNAIRFICGLTTAVTLAFMLTGCGNGDSSGGESGENSSSLSSQAEQSEQSSQAEQNDTQAVTAESVLSQIKDENLDGQAFFGSDVFENNCEKLYGITTAEISDGGIIYSTGGGLADEVSMIKCDNGRQILESRQALRLNTFENYKPEEVDKINSAEIYQKGGYWILIISDNSEKIEKTINSLL